MSGRLQAPVERSVAAGFAPVQRWAWVVPDEDRHLWATQLLTRLGQPRPRDRVWHGAGAEMMPPVR